MGREKLLKAKRMVKKIVRDPLFLAQKSISATEADKQVVEIPKTILNRKFNAKFLNVSYNKNIAVDIRDSGEENYGGIYDGTNVFINQTERNWNPH